MNNQIKRLGASFRDPSGFLFIYQGELYRQVNQAYQEDYEHLMASGLYDSLIKDGLLIPHEEVDLPPCDPSTIYIKLYVPKELPSSLILTNGASVSSKTLLWSRY